MASEKAPTQGQTRDRRILYVDDDPLVLRSVVRAMAGTGMRVDTAVNADEGLAKLEDHEYSVVVSDYRMPGRNGIQFLERVRHVWPDSVCILVSGQADLETVVQAINRVGLFRFIVKPWDIEELRTGLRHACDHFELLKENHSLTRALETRNTELREINQRLDREVTRRTSELLLGLLNALDLRDTETQGHSRRVALYAKRLAEELGLQPEEVLEIERGALLHDIGKIGVSDTILLKPGKLTEEEWKEMRKHTMYGFEILKRMEFLGAARLVVRSHHERYDGKGYPDGTGGTDIYVGARIFAVIDTYDAMTSDRPYRKAMPASVAREEILKHQAAQFDPDCADAFTRIPDEDLFELRDRVALDDAAGLL
jgi:putative nucleotidyltransferase with HDIG domain